MPDPNCLLCIASSQCSLCRVHRETDGTCGLSERSLGAGDTIFTQGTLATHLYVVKVGAMLLRRKPLAGASRAVAVVGQGGMLGTSALFEQGASADAVAYIPTRVCQLDAEAVRGQLARHPQVGLEVGSAAMRLFDCLLQWSVVGRLPDTRQRLVTVFGLLAAVQGSGTIDLPGRDDLAQLCACAPETVSRVMGQLLRTGKLRKLQRGRVQWLG